MLEPMNRREFVKAATVLAASPLAVPAADDPAAVAEYQKPVFNLHKQVAAPVKIAAIELLQSGKQFFVRTRSTDGVEGIVLTKDMEDFVPILHRRVIPHFLGKDARDLETLVDDVYIANYKLSGQAFWCPVAYVEQSLFDLLGRTAHKPAGELMGGILRKEIPVYLSGSGRDTTAEEEVDVYVRGVAETGAKAVKFKIGGRMSANRDTYPGRTDKILELAAKQLAGKVTLMADANGSYSAAKAIEIGKRLQEMKYLWFEEPCPWEELSETKKVADALDMKVAFGEQDSSLWLVSVDDRKQGHRRGAAGSQLQRRIHASGARGTHGAQSEHVDLPAQHANRCGVGEHSAIRGQSHRTSAPTWNMCRARRPKRNPGTRRILKSEMVSSRSRPDRVSAYNSIRIS